MLRIGHLRLVPTWKGRNVFTAQQVLTPTILWWEPSSHLLGTNPLAQVCWVSRHTEVPWSCTCSMGAAGRPPQQKEGQVNEGAVSKPGWLSAVWVFQRVLLIWMWHLPRLSEDDRCLSAPGTNSIALWGWHRQAQPNQTGDVRFSENHQKTAWRDPESTTHLLP